MSALPLILSIESAGTPSSLALHRGGVLLGSMESHIKKKHHHGLAQMVHALLATCDFNIGNLDGVAISSGPGSYTGLRIGLSLAKGICYGAQLPLIGLNTLYVLLEARKEFTSLQGSWMGLIDARRQRGYAATMDHDGQLLQDTHICQLHDDFLTSLPSHPPLFVIGSGADAYADILSQHPDTHIIPHLYPTAARMGWLAYQAFLNKQWVDLASFSPTYLGGSYVRWEGRHQQKKKTKVGPK